MHWIMVGFGDFVTMGAGFFSAGSGLVHALIRTVLNRTRLNRSLFNRTVFNRPRALKMYFIIR